MEGEAGVLEDRVELGPVGRRRVEAGEGVGGEQHEGEEAEGDGGLDGQRPRLEPGRQIVAEGGHGRAVDGEDGDPEQERAFVISPEPGDPVDEGLGRVGVSGDHRDREIRDDEGLHQGAEGDQDAEELGHGRGFGERHEPAVIARRAQHRQGHLQERDDEGESEREMAELGDHWLCPASGRHSPAFFRAAATSGGMYFSSCLASTVVARNVPSGSSPPSTTTPWPSRKRSGSTPL